MRIIQTLQDAELVQALYQGGVAILRTDTLYGIVAKADDEAAVRRVYEMKGRDDDKSPIVLIASLTQLYDEPSVVDRQFIHNTWPGKVSVILPSQNAPIWIRRDNHSVAYRLPANEDLRQLIEKTGPLIAPSANPQGALPAMSIGEAVHYFGASVDVYVDGGRVEDASPSQLVRLSGDGAVERLR